MMLENPIILSDMIKDKDAQIVQLLSLQTYKAGDTENLIGFIGQFKWKDNTAGSCDGEIYNDDMHVYGYEWWENKEEGISCGLDVLVVDDWLKD